MKTQKSRNMKKEKTTKMKMRMIQRKMKEQGINGLKILSKIKKQSIIMVHPCLQLTKKL